MRKWMLFAAALCMFTSQWSFSQDDNLITNPSFEETAIEAKEFRDLGKIEHANGWLSATEPTGDLFMTDARGDKVSVPLNEYGRQTPADGDKYGGFVAYSRERRTNRSYLEVKFITPLEKNRQYCIKFEVSLGDLSKYAVNGIGAHITQKKTTESHSAELTFPMHANVIGNKVVEDMTGWTTVCGTYLAKGGETHMIIGCFERDDQLKIERMRRPSDLTEAQAYLAYYYVDNVSLNTIEAKSQCECGPKALKPDIIYSRSVNITDDMSPAEILAARSVYFGSNTAKLNAVAKRDLDKVVETLKANPDLKVAVVGHMDNDEFDEAKLNESYKGLALERAKNVVDYLVEQGIAKSRMGTVNKENKEPANTRPTPLSIAQNRRVEFVVQ